MKLLLQVSFFLMICHAIAFAQTMVEEKKLRSASYLLNDLDVYQIDQSCGKDRRCRIGRLRDKLRTKRILEAKLEDEQLFKLLMLYETKKRSLYPRLEDNLSFNYIADINFSLKSPLIGLNIMYSLDEHWQVDADILNVSSSFDAGDYYFYNGYQFRVGMNYLNDVSVFSSYYGVAFAYTELNDYDIESPAHTIYLKYGLDWQFITGFHMRLGLYYAVPLYIGLRDSNSKQNVAEPEKSATTAEIASALYGLGMYFHLGFSF